MMTEKEFIKSQKECANMLGMSLSEYENYCKIIKISEQDTNRKKNKKNHKYDNSILKKLGLSVSDLKVRR